MNTLEAAKNWRALELLLKAGGTLYLSATADEGTGDTMVSAVRTRPDGGRETATRGCLDEVVAALSGPIGEKQCRKCKQVRPLNQFSRLAADEATDGRNSYCLVCERRRVKDYARRQRNLAEQKARTPTAAPAPSPPAPRPP
jgi:hypothetical protein